MPIDNPAAHHAMVADKIITLVLQVVAEGISYEVLRQRIRFELALNYGANIKPPGDGITDQPKEEN